MSKQEMIELNWLIREIKSLRQEMLNNPCSKASENVTAVLYAYDTLMAKIEEKVKEVA